ncbi:MAG: hypothetical protein ABIP15_13220 [Devosia sp.]
MQLETPKRRATDRSNTDAQEALSTLVTQFAAWRQDIAKFGQLAERRISTSQRQVMLDRCAAIADEVLAARTELILTLADAPSRVAGNSRVVDMERALDGVERSVGELVRKLGA